MRTVCSKSDYVLQLNAAPGGVRKNSFTLIVGAGRSRVRQLQAQRLHVSGLVGDHDGVFFDA
jgi:hypothetical protein